MCGLPHLCDTLKIDIVELSIFLMVKEFFYVFPEDMP